MGPQVADSLTRMTAHISEVEVILLLSTCSLRTLATRCLITKLTGFLIKDIGAFQVLGDTPAI